MAKSSAKAHDKDKKSKKRKLSSVEQEKEEDSSIYDIEVEKDSSPAPPAHPHPFKRTRQNAGELDTSKPSAVFQPKRGRQWTLSIALPGSFIANTKAIDQKCELAGRIARAAAVFCVDEIVIFDDAPDKIPPQLAHMQGKGKKPKSKAQILSELPEVQEPWDNPDQFLYHMLTFLETPGHLRTPLFRAHPNLKGVGKLPTLDMPHHMRQDEWLQYREGVALAPPGRKTRDSGGAGPEEETLIDCGFKHPVRVACAIPAGSRVTLKFADEDPPKGWPHLTEQQIAALDVEPTSPGAPREEAGYYWGFSVRKADCLSSVYVESPFQEGYDFTLGTSERGVPLSSIMPGAAAPRRKSGSSGEIEKLPDTFHHLLLVFGGVTGLEPAVASDPVLGKAKGLTKETAHEAFDLWVNLVPGQGSRTIRTEEAVWLGLMGTRDYINSQP